MNERAENQPLHYTVTKIISRVEKKEGNVKGTKRGYHTVKEFLKVVVRKGNI